jgi:hypothetical protein
MNVHRVINQLMLNDVENKYKVQTTLTAKDLRLVQENWRQEDFGMIRLTFQSRIFGLPSELM